jgi:hypothetical protein
MLTEDHDREVSWNTTIAKKRKQPEQAAFFLYNDPGGENIPSRVMFWGALYSELQRLLPAHETEFKAPKRR